MSRRVSEIQDDIRTLTKISISDLHDKVNEVAEEVGEVYQQGRSHAIDEVIALARKEIDFESQSEQKRFVEFMEYLKNNEMSF